MWHQDTGHWLRVPHSLYPVRSWSSKAGGAGRCHRCQKPVASTRGCPYPIHLLFCRNYCGPGQTRVLPAGAWASVRAYRYAHHPARALGRDAAAPCQAVPAASLPQGGGLGRLRGAASTLPAVFSSTLPQGPGSCQPYLGKQPGRERGAQAPRAGHWPPGLGGNTCRRRAEPRLARLARLARGTGAQGDLLVLGERAGRVRDACGTQPGRSRDAAG